MSEYNDMFIRLYRGDTADAVDTIIGELRLSRRQREVLREPLIAASSHLVARVARAGTAVALGLVDTETSEAFAGRATPSLSSTDAPAMTPSQAVSAGAKAMRRRNAELPMPTIVIPAEFKLTLPELRGLLNVTFRLGGVDKTWGNATLTDHRVASVELQKQARGLMGHAERHDEVVQLCERAGVETLRDLVELQAKQVA